MRRQEEKARGGQPFTEHSTDASSCSVIILQSQQPTKILKVKILHSAQEITIYNASSYPRLIYKVISASAVSVCI